LKCGHSANATDAYGDPCCAICAGLTNDLDYKTPAESQPALSDRTAKCTYCKKTVKSSLELAFFECRPDRETDNFYCGCRGWD